MADNRERDTEQTTIVTSDGENRGSTGLMLGVVALIVFLLAIVFFSGVFDRGKDDLNVAVTTADMNAMAPPAPTPVVVVPEAQPPTPPAGTAPPVINVNVTNPPPEPLTNVSNTERVVNNGI